MSRLARRRGQATVEIVVVCVMTVLAATIVTRAITPRFPAESPRRAAQAPVRTDELSAFRRRADAASIVAIASALLHVGIHEEGRDRGAWVDRFTARHAEPWCADFVSWVWRSAGLPFADGADGWRIASAPSLQAWFVARKRFLPRLAGVPAPGDVISFVHQHVGIVVAASADDLDTIEGNSGDAVSLRHYHGWRQNPDIAGFGRAPASPIDDGNFPTLLSV